MCIADYLQHESFSGFPVRFFIYNLGSIAPRCTRKASTARKDPLIIIQMALYLHNKRVSYLPGSFFLWERESHKMPNIKASHDKGIKISVIAEILSCTQRHVYKLIKQGELVPIKTGFGALKISESSFDNFIKRHLITPKKKVLKIPDQPD